MADDKEKPKSEEKEKTERQKGISKHIAIIILVIFGAFIVFAAGMGLDRAGLRRHHPGVGGTGMFGMHERPFGGRGFGGGGQGMMPRGDNENRLAGVVTAINGSSFTIAGGGSTNTVQANDSTQYTGADKVATNDSVVVVGTINNGTFTASQVVINP
jgi:hypothetical protein